MADPIPVSSAIDTFMRSANTAAMRAASGFRIASDTKVFHVEAYGNDSTADGSRELPYLTAQAAYNAAYHATLPRVIKLGVGSFGNIAASFGWPKTLFICGAGYSVSSVTNVTVSEFEGYITSDKTLKFSTIYSVAQPESSGQPLTVVGVAAGTVGAAADESYTPGDLLIQDCFLDAAATDSMLGNLTAIKSSMASADGANVTLACCVYGSVG